MNKKQYEVLEKAVKTWGEAAQTDMMIEEMAELTKALLNNRRGRESNISEEMADVYIMLKQLEIIFENKGKINHFINEKIKRLEERLKGK
ncbi:MAG: hypothetical protein HDQ97_09095 [Lachnospiraceae bacterium]|nr:hypothetical protein [Lachnospiraceae bacterium]